ncbi:DUF2326 domain-containing protein [Shewanella benthica]|uniref:DUF2326 domain-containing protein n=1 Tax=Shewanella benthica TaxID=43661 RepID=UPI0018792EA9|nr:DUF2326 domain-containing protein [Shewanella benthica]MBE7214707.1 DUF2326 domain-containing protein [Shewanella benthica]MCL1063151.1 DUF2326 domain-containing protein [Shewanella benthica]
MLKLSRLYSNNHDVFPDIIFRDGLNIVFANVSKNQKNKSSHSLGKTTLVDLLNFTLLKQVDKNFFLKKKIFHDFTFFLEVEYKKGLYVTIKRPVNGKICIHSNSRREKFNYLEDKEWEHHALGLNQAKELLNSFVSINGLAKSNYTYRNGLRYCLRKQTQYESTFKVNSSREADSAWKPYLAEVLGIDSLLVKEKYSANKQVESIKNAIKEINSLPQESTQSLEAEIAQIEAHIMRMQSELDKFDFRKVDTEISSELIEEVSLQVSDFNKRIYEIDQRIYAINESVKTEFSFDLDKVVELFGEVKIHFPDQLTHSYEELIALNTQMSVGRKSRLKTAKKRLLEDRGSTVLSLDAATEKQKYLAGLLLQKDAFSKYKLMQSRLSKEDSRLAVLNERVEKLDQASSLSDRLKTATDTKISAEKSLEKATRVRDNIQMRRAVEIFSELVEQVLSISAFFYTKTNTEGNLEFNIGLKDQTSVNDGFSYTRTLSAIFDLTLLSMYSQESFYRFSYHDGLLESLDDRVKFKLIDKMRSLSESLGLQLIISVLDSDVPILESGERDYFPQKEIIRELHDNGKSGRLFKMDAF